MIELLKDIKKNTARDSLEQSDLIETDNEDETQANEENTFKCDKCGEKWVLTEEELKKKSFICENCKNEIPILPK